MLERHGKNKTRFSEWVSHSKVSGGVFQGRFQPYVEFFTVSTEDFPVFQLFIQELWKTTEFFERYGGLWGEMTRKERKAREEDGERCGKKR